LRNFIAGWNEGLQTMVVGEKKRLWIPQDLAFQGKPGAPPGMLVFDVELLEIQQGPKPIPAPPDVAAAPKDATKTKSGIAFKVLQPGTGKEHPKAEDTDKVNY